MRARTITTATTLFAITAVACGPMSPEDDEPGVVQIVATGSFADPAQGDVTLAGSGSGFIIDPSGLIVTNNHVVTGAATLEVMIEGESHNARVLGVSECSDLAVIEVDAAEDLFALEWREDPVEPNTEVWALGYPLGEPTFTVTRGIISKPSTARDTQWASVRGVIEHDARIRPGSSGGPLVAEDGTIVGVNYAGNTEHDINLAIDAPLAKDLVARLVNGHDVDSIGLNGFAFVLEDGSFSGIWVSSVKSGSSASYAGVMAGDILLSLEGIRLGADGTMKDYCDIVRTQGDSAVMRMKLYRWGEDRYYEGALNSGEPLVRLYGDGAYRNACEHAATLCDPGQRPAWVDNCSGETEWFAMCVVARGECTVESLTACT